MFWMWFAALLGMLVKYGEIYLGVKFRIKNNENSYTGGPMIFLKHVPGGKFWSVFATILMCLYGIEIYIFRVVTASICDGWHFNPYTDDQLVSGIAARWASHWHSSSSSSTR